MWNEIKRKAFHLIGLLYVVGLIFIPRPTYIAILVCLLALETLAETIRLKSERVNDWLIQNFGKIFREAEKTKLSGVFWMLLGVTLTVLITDSIPIGAASILYLILGDGVASLAGMRFGGPHWPGSNRRLSGSLACFLVCLFIGFIVLKPVFGWPLVWVGAIAATLFESGFMVVNDNITIPAGSAAILLLTLRFLA